MSQVRHSSHVEYLLAPSPQAWELVEPLEMHRVVIGVQPLSLGASGTNGDAPSGLAKLNLKKDNLGIM
jgi:hypothetical protein